MAIVFSIVLVLFLLFLAAARILNGGPFDKDKGKFAPEWEWWNTDHSPGPDGKLGRWVERS